MNRTWLVGATTVTRTVDDSDVDLLDLTYDIQIDTNCGKFTWQFSTSVTNSPDLFAETDTYTDYSQNGPESFLQLKADADTIEVQCEPTTYMTHLPTGVVKSIIDDLHGLAKDLTPQPVSRLEYQIDGSDGSDGSDGADGSH